MTKDEKSKKRILNFLDDLIKQEKISLKKPTEKELLIMDFLKVFGTVEVTEDNDETTVKVVTEPAKFFISSLRTYINEDLSMISDWNYLGDKESENGQSILNWGLRFTNEAEKRRVEKLRSTTILNDVSLVLVLIKGKFNDGVDRYLAEYSLTTQRYQLVGGYLHESDDDHIAAIKRNLLDDIPLTRFDFKKGIKVTKVPGDIKSNRVSRQKGVYTQYTINLYHLEIDLSKLTLSGKERWISIDEMMQGKTSHGIKVITPFGDTNDTDKLADQLDKLPYSFKNTQQLPRYQKNEIRAGKDKLHTITSLLGDEEGENLEFKSSARWDYKQGKVNREMGRMIIKTISGFMNSSGGYLLIGVEDDGSIKGISKDLKTLNKKNEDGYQLFIMGQVADIIGKEFSSFIDISFEAFEGKVVCIVKVRKATQPVFVKDGKEREFYVRTGNSTRSLNLEETYRYIRFNWD